MKFVAIALVCTLSAPAYAEWTPPEKPDPQQIFREAQADAAAKRYEDALAKHVWYHENALKHSRALAGVRLSFAISSWIRLGKSYPPALVKLKAVRDDACKAVAGGSAKNVRETFQEVVSINKGLGDEAETTTFFKQIDKDNAAVAKQIYEQSQPSLVKAKEYKLCGKYLTPKATLESSKEQFQTTSQNAKDAKVDPKGRERIQQFAENKFKNDTTTLVALLVVNDRKQEATEIAAEAKKAWANDEFNNALDMALKGTVPDPWP